MEDNNLDKFKFVKRRLSVHYSISREMASDKDSLLSTPNRSPSKNNKSIKRRTILMQEKSIKKLKDIYLKNNSGLFFHNEERLSDYIEKLLNQGLLVIICECLKSEDCKDIAISLESLNNLLEYGKKISSDGQNCIVYEIERLGMIDYLENLQFHPNEIIYEKVLHIIETFFQIE